MCWAPVGSVPDAVLGWAPVWTERWRTSVDGLEEWRPEDKTASMKNDARDGTSAFQRRGTTAVEAMARWIGHRVIRDVIERPRRGGRAADRSTPSMRKRL